MRVSDSGPNCRAFGRAPRSVAVSASLSALVMTVTVTTAVSTPGSAARAAFTSDSIRSAAGHPTIVSLISARTVDPSTSTGPTMSSSVIGLRISGSIPAPSALGRRPQKSSGVLRLVEFLEHRTKFGADEVLARHVLHGEAKRHDLPSQVLGVVQVAFGAHPVLLDLHTVAVVLTVLRKQDQGSGV